MLKRIRVAYLQPGMHVHELCGSWMSHPFWRASFALDDADLERILDSGIQEAWIDTDKGLDVDFGQSRAQVDLQIDRELNAVAGSAVNAQKPVPLSEEVERAARTCARSKEAVISMFQEVRMGKAVDAENARQLVEQMHRSILRNPHALVSIARVKRADDYTYMHSVAVCALMIALAKQLGLDERQTRDAGFAGLLHDIGKMAIPIDVLNKQGKLSEAEFALVKTHPEAGQKMLRQGGDISEAALDVCLHHHERVDATGYPRRLPGESISLLARMCAVCDVYDAITSDRSYKRGWDPAEAVRKMAEWTDGHLHKAVFHAFVKAVGIYPVGTLVRLQSDRLAVVVDQSGPSLLTPKVKVFFSLKSQLRERPEIVDLARPGCSEKIVAHESPTKWAFPGLRELWRGSDTGFS